MASQEIICGPIIRRTELKKVSVWVAFRKSQQVRLNIWEGDNIKHSGNNRLFNFASAPLATSAGHTEQFGKNLFIALITAEIPLPGLDSTKVYSYNMVFNETDSPVENDFLSDKLLADGTTEGGRPQLAIGYEKDVLPTFVLPGSTPDKLVIAHGSCRKMHGYGQDALALLDDEIKNNIADLTKRPQALFCTGDQIYADEVPAILLRHLGVLDGTGLFGGLNTEKMRIQADGGPLKELEADKVTYPPYFRERLLNKFAGFSSQAAANHLISFEEFCGCYLNYWNVRSWHEDLVAYMKKVPKLGEANREDKINEVISSFLDGLNVEDDPNLLTVIKDEGNSRKTNEFIFSDDTITRADFNSNPKNKKLEDWLKEKRHLLKEEIAQVVNFYSKLPNVSRVLANISTYMIMDDHEVTDDWFMTQRWNNQVLSKPFGRDIIRNAMMAYSIFQDWGNVPDEYMEGSNKPRANFFTQVKEFCFRYGENQNLNSIRAEVIDPMEVMLGMNGNKTSIYWHYGLKLGASQVLVLDTRTQRKYKSLNTTPELISSDSLLGQGTNVQNGQTPDTLTDNPPFIFVVSPCPVLGLSNFEELVQPAVTALFGTLKNENNLGLIAGQFDFDFEAWAYNVDGIERLLNRLNNYKNVILLSGDVHFGATSVLDYWKGNSNAPTSRIVQLISSGFKNEWISNAVVLKSSMVQKILTSFGESVSKLGWLNKIISRSGNITARNRMRLMQTTSTIPVEGWTPGATLSPAPDFRWRLKLLKDERPIEGDPVTADVILDNPTSLKDGYFNIVQRHQKMYKEGKTKRIAWNSNIGVVKFKADGASWKLQHNLLGAGLLCEVPMSTPVPEQSKPVLP